MAPNEFETTFQEAMYNPAVDLGYESEYVPVADTVVPSDADVMHALRESVSMAAVLNDLCNVLGIEPTEVVMQALVMDTEGSTACAYVRSQIVRSSLS